MATITIPKNLIKNDDLIILPRKEYERLFLLAKKRHTKLDRDLDKAIEEVRQGKVIGPFNSIKSLRASLEK